MNDKTTLKLVRIIMGDKTITDSDKLEAVKKLTVSTITYQSYYPYQQCTDPYPITYQPQWTFTSGSSATLIGDTTAFELTTGNTFDPELGR